MAYVRPYRTSQAKGPGLPRVDWSRVPRGLTSNPLFQCNQCPDVVGDVPAYSWWQGDRGLVPTQWGLGLNAYFSEVSYPIPHSQFSKSWSRAVLFKTPSSVGPWGLCWDTGYGSERNLSINGSAKASGYFWPSTPVTLTGTTTLQGNTLYMICMTYEGGVATLYLNGVQEAQGTGYSDNPFYAATTTYGSNGANGGDGGSILAGFAANVCWTPQEALDLWRAPFAHLIFQDELAYWMRDAGLVPLLLGAGAVSVTLTGSSVTASRGSLTAGIGYTASGSSATSAAGTLTSALGSSVSGSAGTGALGTVTPGIGVSVSGSALTVSAGTLAYTIGFTLTGASSASAGGTISSSGGDTESERALTGISMSALPGNVRVTGGTRWVPQEARAATVATSAGNTMPPPPRLTGDVQADIRAQQQYLQTFYDQFVKVNNVLGRINDHETRIAALEGDT